MPILPKNTIPQLSDRLQLDRDFAGRQILGSRDEQQDSYAFSVVEGDDTGADQLLVIVADGMGGHTGGREASVVAVRGFIDAFFGAIDSRKDLTSPPREEPPSRVPEGKQQDVVSMCNDSTASPPTSEVSLLKTALLAANLAVDKMIASDPNNLGEAGTTLVAALIGRGSIHWVSVGDSLLLLWRNNKLARLNVDHSMRAVFAEKVAVGQMRAADIATHPERNALLAVLNGLEIQKTDEPSEPVALVPGDMIIAASDGLLTLTAAEISKALKRLSKAPALDIVRNLLKEVEKKSNPKQDNTTIAIVRV